MKHRVDVWGGMWVGEAPPRTVELKKITSKYFSRFYHPRNYPWVQVWSYFCV